MSLNKLGADIAAEGDKGELPVEDNDQIGLLLKILDELKILNMHMSVMTDNQFTEAD